MTTTPPTTYQERAGKTWTRICVSLYLAGVAVMGVAALPEDFWPWLAVSALFSLLLLPLLAVPISKNRYHSIDLTPETLRVGRERIPVADLDPWSVRAALDREVAGQRGVMQNLASSMNSGFTIKGKNIDPTLPRLVGGAWAVPMGMASVQIATRHGEQLLIASRHPTDFLQALAQVVR